MATRTQATVSATELEERTKSGDALLLGSDVGVGDRTLPQTWFVQEWPKARVRFVRGQRELLGGIFVGSFSNFPDLSQAPVSTTRAAKDPSPVLGADLVGKSLWQRERAEILLLVSHDGLATRKTVICRA